MGLNPGIDRQETNAGRASWIKTGWEKLKKTGLGAVVITLLTISLGSQAPRGWIWGADGAASSQAPPESHRLITNPTGAK